MKVDKRIVNNGFGESLFRTESMKRWYGYCYKMGNFRREVSAELSGRVVATQVNSQQYPSHNEQCGTLTGHKPCSTRQQFSPDNGRPGVRNTVSFGYNDRGHHDAVSYLSCLSFVLKVVSFNFPTAGQKKEVEVLGK